MLLVQYVIVSCLIEVGRPNVIAPKQLRVQTAGAQTRERTSSGRRGRKNLFQQKLTMRTQYFTLRCL